MQLAASLRGVGMARHMVGPMHRLITAGCAPGTLCSSVRHTSRMPGTPYAGYETSDAAGGEHHGCGGGCRALRKGLAI